MKYLQLKPKSMLYHERGGKQVLGLKSKANNPILSLTAMLEEEGEEGEAIPVEVIKSFLQRKEETTLRRQELRFDFIFEETSFDILYFRLHEVLLVTWENEF